MRKYLVNYFAFALFVLFSANAFSKTIYHNKGIDSAIGKPGDPDKVSRIIKITVLENLFLPSEIDVKQGETIKFVIKNGGNEQHEMIIDTIKNLKKQAKWRRNSLETKAAGPNQIQLNPGEQKELIWAFTEAGIIDFACPLPGHFKAMRGKIHVEKK